MEIHLPLASLRRLLVVVVSVVTALGLVVEVAHHVLGWEDPYDLVDLLSLSYEANLPTWIVVVLLFTTGVLLANAAAAKRREGDRFTPHWWVLAATFFYISIDELVQIHESLGKLFDLDGVLYFSWVIPAAVLVSIWVAAFVPFLRHLPARTRNRFLAAGAIYVFGALVLELPLGWWADQHGNDNAGYALIDWVEETLELVGVGAFLFWLVEYLVAPGEKVPAAAVRKREIDAGAAPVWLAIVFFLSGAAALVYQVAWQRALFALYGLDVVSVTMVVSAFMLGLGVGSLAGGALSRWAPYAAVPLFGAFELGIGLFGFSSIRIFDQVAEVTIGSGHLATGVLAFLLLLVPTTLMGATLPLLVGWLAARSGNTGRSVGTLYFVNTLGAAAGAYLAVKVLLREYGLSGSVAVAGGLNALLGLTVIAAVWFERRRAARPPVAVADAGCEGEARR